MPENAIYVGRPTKWGNPYKKLENSNIQEILECYTEWIALQLDHNPHFLDELKGKELACWCPLDKPCHADVLLKFLERLEREKA
jgi:hypothetical protein